ncbi:putative N6-adenine methyltransferase-domain-containing protein [Scheffersomyces xylosifermentans]|uniref:putative N6-adenine methyltransferase-domain-containing protein n=1 Tax=Scheffersomyces xylosifermentans TaxID=1304137 RepID=UPI00315DF4B5
MDSDDEPLTLSAHALAALSEFKTEEKERLEKFEAMYKSSEEQFDKNQTISIDVFQEDWQLSQFWYTDMTAATLGRALLDGADSTTVVVIASAPSVYAAIKNFAPEDVPTEHIYLLEFDDRFRVLGGPHFSKYDYNYPEDIPEHLRNKCHRLLIDPPFLEPECQTKSAQAAKNLLVKDKNEKTTGGDLKFKLITSTGERMKEVVQRNYPDTKQTNYYPEHKNGLSNEFRCYASFECNYWQFESDEN